MNGSKLKYIFLMAVRYLAHRRFATSVSMAAIAFSLLFLVGVGVVNFAIKRTAVEGSIRYPLVVGPAGASGVQLILSTIFHIDKPTGTIPFSVYEDLKADRRVSKAYPLAVADTFKNYRIIGTNEDFLNDLGVGAVEGKIDLSRKENTVFGFEVARRTGVRPGDGFHGQHGMVGSADAHEHKELTYKVTGILAPTGGPEDTAIYSSYESVWYIHEEHLKHHDHARHDKDQGGPDAQAGGKHPDKHHDGHQAGKGPHRDKYMLTGNMLTAVLVQTRNPVYTGMLEREYSLKEGTQGVDTGKSIRDFVRHMNKGEVLIETMSAVTLAIAIIMILVTLVMSLNERRKELALMRSLGIGRMTIASIVMVEALFITIGGCLAGLILGHFGIWFTEGLIKNAIGVSLEPFVVTSMEYLGITVTIAAGQLLALISMIWTYRMNLVEEIAKD